MNIFYKVAAIVYINFKSRKVSGPYLTALMMIYFLFFIHLAQLLLAFGISTDVIISWSSDEPKLTQWYKAAFSLILFVSISSLLLPKKKLEKVNVSENQIRKANLILPIYIVSSIVILMALLVMHGVKKGTLTF
jgi:hypothetical protein